MFKSAYRDSLGRREMPARFSTTCASANKAPDARSKTAELSRRPEKWTDAD